MSSAKSDVERLYMLNRQFHTALLSAAKNRFLVKAAEAVEKTLLILGPSTMEEGDRASEAISEHGKVLEALHVRNGGLAESEMRQHIEAAHRARLRQLRSKADV
jgi:DNA-binding GntR family transcriptional regulator